VFCDILLNCYTAATAETAAVCDDALRRKKKEVKNENEEVILPRGYVFEFLFI